MGQSMGDSNMCDPAMLELFRAEMDTHVPVLSEGLLALERGQAGDKDFEAMMRAAHSIKGAARIMGVEAAVRVAHVMEDCFSAAQGHRIALSSEAVDVLLQGVDTLQRICSPQADPGMTEPSIQGLIDRITAIRDGQPRPQQQVQAHEPTVSPVAVELATPTAASQECRVALPAVLDASAAESLRIELSNALRHERPQIRLDFAQVRHLSATALSLLASFARETARAEATTMVEAEGVSAEVAVLLQTTGLDGTFKRRE
jgi:anti-anti-sigma factor